MSETQILDDITDDGKDSEPIENPMLAAQLKRTTLSHFGTTFEDEKVLGSPPRLLKLNPGKTLGELLSDEDLLKRLDELSRFHEDAELEFKNNPSDIDVQRDFEYAKRELSAAIRYLDSIGRLPEKYKNHRG